MNDGLQERLMRIETQMTQVATREDLQKIKVWVLVGLLTVIGAAVPAAVGATVLFLRLIFGDGPSY